MEKCLDYIENRGAERKIIDLICKKLRRGEDVEQIEYEVEEDIVRVQMICNIADKYAPDYDVKKIVEEVMETTMAV